MKKRRFLAVLLSAALGCVSVLPSGGAAFAEELTADDLTVSQEGSAGADLIGGEGNAADLAGPVSDYLLEDLGFAEAGSPEESLEAIPPEMDGESLIEDGSISGDAEQSEGDLQEETGSSNGDVLIGDGLLEESDPSSETQGSPEETENPDTEGTGELSEEEIDLGLEEEEMSESVEEETEADLITAAGETSGKCGDNLSWNFDSSTGTLSISGTGDMQSYSTEEKAPWVPFSADIKNLVLGEGITSLGEAAFLYCSSLERVEFPSTIQRVEKGAFAYCYDLKEAVLNEGMTNLPMYVFEETAITHISLPASLKEYEPYAFFEGQLESLEVSPGNSVFVSENDALLGKDRTILYAYPSEKTGQYQIPSTVKKIEHYAFLDSSCSDITIPEGVESLAEGAFFRSDITSIRIPNSVKEIGDFAFQECPKATVLSIGDGLEALSYRTFSECSSLEEATLGKALRDLNYLAFAECAALKSVIIPEGVTVIPNGTFGDCYSLQSVTFPSTLQEIWYQAFLNCESLAEISLPSGLRTINRYAFWGTGIKQVAIPETVTSIGENAFPEGTVFNVPDGLTQFEDGSFEKVPKVTMEAKLLYQEAFKILDLANEERAKVGAGPLQMDSDLLKAAMLRVQETALLFSHTRPSDRDCFTASAKMVSENIAAGGSSAADAVNMWMNSQGHRENMLNANRKSIGIGAAKIDGMYYWVQCFGSEAGDNPSRSSYSDKTVKTEISFVTSTEELSFGASSQDTSLKAGESSTIGMYFDNTFVDYHVPQSNLSYASSNTAVCTVKNAKVTAAGPGKAEISVWLTKYPEVKASVSFTVAGSPAADLSKAKITLKTSSYVYDGKEKKPTVSSVSLNGKTLKSGTDYKVSYKNNKNAGTAYVIITGKGKYTGKAKIKFTIKQASVTFKSTSKTLAYKTLKKKSLSYSVIKASDGGKVSVSYLANGKISKSVCKKYVSVSSKGKVTVKKGAKKGTYKLKVTVTAKGNYKKTAKTIAITVK